MKKIIALFSLFLSTIAFSQGFTPVELHGFGKIQNAFSYNSEIIDMTTFKGSVFAATGPVRGRVYKSTTGDGGSFSPVIDDTLSESCGKFTSTNDAGGLLYAIHKYQYNGNTYHSDRLMQTSDGLNWSIAYQEPTNGPLDAAFCFNGSGAVDSVYIFVHTAGSNVVKRREVASTNPNAWTTVLDLSQTFGDYSTIKSVFELNDTMYFSTSFGYIYKTGDGLNYSLVGGNYDMQVGLGSNSPNAFVTSTLKIGSSLYIGTQSVSGDGQIFETTDMINFTLLNGFPGYSQVNNLIDNGGTLTALVADYTGAFSIVYYTGGGIFSDYDLSSFQTPDLWADMSSGLTIFNNHLYVGIKHNGGVAARNVNPNNSSLMGPSNSLGGRIYRQCLVGPNPVVSISPDTILVCPSTTYLATATNNSNSYIWTTGSTTNTSNVSNPGVEWITGINLDGCRASDDITVLNYPVLPVFFTNDTMILSANPLKFCEGDSIKFTARAGDNPYNSLSLPNGINGLQTPTVPTIGAGADSYTIEAWVRINSTNDGVIVSEYDFLGTWNENNSAIFYIQTGNLYVSIPGSGQSFNVTSANNMLNKWIHLALTYDEFADECHVYFNGSDYGSYYFIPATNPLIGSTGYKLGLSASIPNLNGITGNVRDFRVWSAVRTPAEILNNMNFLTGSATNLVCRYKLDEGTGTIANDVSGNNLTTSITSAFASATVVNYNPDPQLIDLGGNDFKAVYSGAATFGFNYADNQGCIQPLTYLTIEPYYVNLLGLPAAVCGSYPAQISFSHNLPTTTPIGSWTSPQAGIIQVAGSTFSYSPTSAEYLKIDLSGNVSCALLDSIQILVGGDFSANNPFGSTTQVVKACRYSNANMSFTLAGLGTPPYTFEWNVSGNKSTTANPYFSVLMDSLPYSVYVTAYDSIGCPMQNAPNYSLSTLFSTDLLAHVTTQAATPVNPGDIYVFKYAPAISSYDTVGSYPLNANGEVLISALTAGPYLIKAIPNPTSYPNSVDTYFGNAYQWDSAQVYNHGCTQTDTTNIQVIDVLGGGGPGTISGYVFEDPGFGSRMAPGDPIPGVGVNLGRKPGGASQLRTTTNSSGQYSFTGVPLGDYWIFADIPNMPMDSTRTVTIDATNQNSANNNYWVDSTTIYVVSVNVGLLELNQTQGNSVVVYPNPIKDNFNVQFTSDKYEVANIELYNQVGELVYIKMIKTQEGKNTININDALNVLSQGAYTMRIKSASKTFTQKFAITQ